MLRLIASHLDSASVESLCDVCQNIRTALTTDAEDCALQTHHASANTQAPDETDYESSVVVPEAVVEPVHFPAFALFPQQHRDMELSDSDSGDEGNAPAEVGNNAERLDRTLTLRVEFPEIPETPCLSLSSPGRPPSRVPQDDTTEARSETPVEGEHAPVSDTDTNSAAITTTATEKTEAAEEEKDDLDSFERRFKAMGGAARSTKGIGFGVDDTGKRYARRVSSPTPEPEETDEHGGRRGRHGGMFKRKKHASTSDADKAAASAGGGQKTTAWKHRSADTATAAAAAATNGETPLAKPVVPDSQPRTPTQRLGRHGRGVVRFAELLELPQFRGLKTGLQRFFQLFPTETKSDPEEEVRAVHCLIADLEKTLMQRSVWKSLPPAQLAAAKEDMQRYVYERLMPVIFYKMAYRTPNKKILSHHKRLRKVITPQYLDIDPAVEQDPMLATAVRILEKIDTFKTPAEKLRCITAACKVLMTLITRDGTTAGADQFLPLFIYVVLHADLHLLQSDIEFISRFMDPELKYSEGYCFFTHLVSAYTFLAQQGEYARDDGHTARGDSHVRVRVHQPAWDRAFQRVARETGKAPHKIALGEMYDAERETVDALAHAADALPASPPAALVMQLLSKYRCLWGVVQNHVPGPEDIPARVTTACLELPTDTTVTALAVAGTLVFAGFSSGRIVRYDSATSTASAPVALFLCGITKLLAIRPAPESTASLVWCLSERGDEALVECQTLKVLRCSTKAVHTTPFFHTVDACLAPSDNTVWSMAVTIATGMKVTQMAHFDPISGTALLRFPQRSWVTCTAFHQDRFWALFDDGCLRSFEGSSGVPHQAIPLAATAFHNSTLCAGSSGMYVLEKGDVYAFSPRGSKIEDGEKSPFDKVAFYESGDSTGEEDPFVAMCFSQPASENSRSLLATMTDSGEVKLWDTDGQAPKQVLFLQGPHQPERLVYGEQEHRHTIAISKENRVYTWTLLHKNRT